MYREIESTSWLRSVQSVHFSKIRPGMFKSRFLNLFLMTQGHLYRKRKKSEICITFVFRFFTDSLHWLGEWGCLFLRTIYLPFKTTISIGNIFSGNLYLPPGRPPPPKILLSSQKFFCDIFFFMLKYLMLKLQRVFCFSGRINGLLSWLYPFWNHTTSQSR